MGMVLGRMRIGMGRGGWERHREDGDWCGRTGIGMWVGMGMRVDRDGRMVMGMGRKGGEEG